MTVGISASPAAHGVIRAALHEADRLDARLVVVHSVEEPLDDATRPVAGAGAGAALRLRQRRLEELTSELAAEKAEVPVEVLVVTEPPGEALLRAAAESSYVVVTRRHHQLLFPALGGVVRGPLNRCPCPALVVDPWSATVT